MGENQKEKQVSTTTKQEVSSSSGTISSDKIRLRRALISVSDKTGLLPFAQTLSEYGVEIISTGGTARALAQAGIAVTPIENVTGMSEMMDGRVKTLHPTIHGGLLASRDDSAHVASMHEHNIEPIDLVCVNLYPFEQTIQKTAISRDEAIEQIDIGGPAMIRSAAKNHKYTAVITDTSQYQQFSEHLQANDGAIDYAFRKSLAHAAFTRTAQYDLAISEWMNQHESEALPSIFQLSLPQQSELRYGENPHQQAALYREPGFSGINIVTAELLTGKPLSYNNINDGAAALELVRELRELDRSRFAAAVIKHTNPCGAAVADDPGTAVDSAYAGDPLAAYGGILAVSTTIDGAVARRICEGSKFFEVIVAEAFTDDAIKHLSERWRNIRLLPVGPFEQIQSSNREYRSLPGGMLVQDRDVMSADTAQWRHAAGPKPSPDLVANAAVLWCVVKHLKSNAVCIGASGQLFGAGAGQMDRVASCRIAIEKAGSQLDEAEQCIAASDAFFPFPDGPELLINAGVTCIVHPGGSKRDQDTFELCDKRNVTCLTTAIRHFRH